MTYKQTILSIIVTGSLVAYGCGEKAEDDGPKECTPEETQCGADCVETVSIDVNGTVMPFLAAPGTELPADLQVVVAATTFTGADPLDAAKLDGEAVGTYAFEDVNVSCVSLALTALMNDPEGVADEVYANTMNPLQSGRPESDITGRPLFVMTKATEAAVNTALQRGAGEGIEEVGAVVFQILDADMQPVAGATVETTFAATIEYPALAGGDGMATDASGVAVITDAPFAGAVPAFTINAPGDAEYSRVDIVTSAGLVIIYPLVPQPPTE